MNQYNLNKLIEAFEALYGVQPATDGFDLIAPDKTAEALWNSFDATTKAEVLGYLIDAENDRILRLKDE